MIRYFGVERRGWTVWWLQQKKHRSEDRPLHRQRIEVMPATTRMATWRWPLRRRRDL